MTARRPERLLTPLIVCTTLLGTGDVAANAQVVTVPRSGELALDGRLEDLVGGRLATLSSGPRAADTGAAGATDLDVEVLAGWNATGLHIGLVWTDDVLDAIRIPYGDATWTDPAGDRRDRMYFYDNVRVRITTPEGRYDVWLTPMATGPLQWTRVRGSGAIPGVEAAGRSAAGRTLIELSIPWPSLGIEPGAGTGLELNLVATDSDRPDAPLEDKQDALAWVDWSGTVRLAGPAGAPSARRHE